MEKNINPARKQKLEIIDWLIELFPNTFFKKGNQIKPLKIGIYDDIIEFYERLESPPYSKKSIREALSYYSASPSYLLCQKEHVARIDIYGIEVDTVNLEQAKYAHQRYLERYQAKPKEENLHKEQNL